MHRLIHFAFNQPINHSINPSFLIPSFFHPFHFFLHSIIHHPEIRPVFPKRSSLELKHMLSWQRLQPQISDKAMSWHLSSQWKPCTQSREHPGSMSTGSRSVHLVDSLVGGCCCLVCYTDVAVPLLLRGAQSKNKIGWLRWRRAWRCIVSDNKVLSQKNLIQRVTRWAQLRPQRCGEMWW